MDSAPVAENRPEAYICLKVSTKVETRNLVDGPFRLGEWKVEPRLNRLTKDGESIQIELKMMDVLVCLANHAGELVERQQLVDTVWATEFISENILTRAVAELRNVLGDDARNPSFIETIHRRGYRLIAPVEPTAATVHPFPARAGRPGEERSPYPGLSAFTEDDAEFFFGREPEISQIWRKLTARRLLALIGPSGVGKSSLLRAGLIPSAPEGWGVIYCQPGDSPYSALARALAPEFRDDPDAIAKLVDIPDDDTAVAVFSRWRGLHDHVLLVIDQFEELFTQNPLEIQERFAVVLRRLSDQSGVNVLLALRDDFLIACNDHEPLTPVFADLTPIKAPARAALRRAIVNPASSTGYTFEDEKLVNEMLDAVEGEQGALPLLAFTVARLWEERDRERRMLTREAYETIGGVHGSLALHAETTLASIDGERRAIVRELFRNLVTAQGTRASREVGDLLSVFDDRQEAAKVLAVLTDARLLNASEFTDDEGGSHRSAEIVHESLLGAWPRLVRWQTQDADAAQLRDQLRQAAQTWDEHERPNDVLWTGKTFREFSVWRENYPGGLSEIEEDFSRAMTAHAKRRMRRRRIAVTAGVAVLLAVLGVITVSRQQALNQARHAEAQKLLALGQVELEGHPTATLAFTRASLDLADTHEGRLLALRALWQGGAARILELPGSAFTAVDMSPDGKHVAFSGNDQRVLVYERDGGPARVFSDHATSVTTRIAEIGLNGYHLVTGVYSRGQDPEAWVVYDLRDGVKLRTVEITKARFKVLGDVVYSASFPPTTPPHSVVRACPIGSSEPVVIGTIEGVVGSPRNWDVDPEGKWFAYRSGSTLNVRPIEGFGPSTERTVGAYDQGTFSLSFLPGGAQIATFQKTNEGNEIRIWPLHNETGGPPRSVAGPASASGPRIGATGNLVAYGSTEQKSAYIVDLSGPPSADPLVLRRRDATQFEGKQFSPDGQWLVNANMDSATFWWLGAPRPFVISGQTGRTYELLFSPDSRWLASGGRPRKGVMLWPLTPNVGEARHLRWRSNYGWCYGLAADPNGERLLVAGEAGPVVILPLDGGEPTYLLEATWNDPATQCAMGDVAFDRTGRFAVAATSFSPNPEAMLLRVWDLETGELVSYPLWGGGERATDFDGGIFDLRFSPDGTLYSAGVGGLRRWDLAEGTQVVMVNAKESRMDLTSDGRFILFADGTGDYTLNSLRILDLESSDLRRITSHGDQIRSIAVDPTGEFIVTGSIDGTVRVGPATGAEPHLLLGHESNIDRVAVSPDRRWIASAAGGETFIWPMPDLSKPPFQTLSHDELMAKLETSTNLRVVRDETSPTGWSTEIGPFPGWETLPKW